MPEFVIDCPETGEPVTVARVSDRASFEQAAFEDKSVHCPHCGEAHAWEKKEAWLEGERGNRGPSDAAS